MCETSETRRKDGLERSDGKPGELSHSHLIQKMRHKITRKMRTSGTRMQDGLERADGKRGGTLTLMFDPRDIWVVIKSRWTDSKLNDTQHG